VTFFKFRDDFTLQGENMKKLFCLAVLFILCSISFAESVTL